MGLNEEIFELYQKHVNPSLAASLRLAGLDVVEDHASGAYVWDADGKRYLDFLGLYGAMALGHGHPKVVAAVKAQLDRMAMPVKTMMDRGVAELARKLCEIAPGDMSYAFFGNSGAEAVEGAIKIARASTGRHKIVSAYGGFHGKTMGALSLTPKREFQEPFRPLIGGVAHVPYGDAAALEAVLDDDTAAVILEPIQGEGGVIVPPAGYFARVRAATAERGILLIADEVQTGMGRTGRWFGLEHEGVAPDMITMAKSLGGGVMPIGAFLARAELWKPFEEDYKVHSTTFGGNPLACAAALATIEAIEEEGLLANAAERGEELLAGLRAIAADFPYFVSEVRGRGLIIGMDFRDADVGTLFISEMSRHGVLTAYGLNQPKMIRIEPPLNITSEHVREGLTAIRSSLEGVRDELERYGLLEDLVAEGAAATGD